MRFLTEAEFDGQHAGPKEPCPICHQPIVYGNGVIAKWHRVHYWCKHKDDRAPKVVREERLPSGAVV